jgi:glycosyltransferase involved in cell wall biosynthesis
MNRPLRVLHVLNALRPSGAERMLALAGPLFAAAGVEGEILSTAPREAGPFAAELERAGFALHFVPFRKSPGFFVELRRVVRAGGYDIVHVHAERASFWVLLTALLAGSRRPIRTVHSTFDFGGLLQFRRAVQRNALHVLGVRYVAIGEAVADVERRCLHNEPVVIRNWFDGKAFRPATPEQRRTAREQLGISDGAQVVATVGNCGAAKNHELLIRALALLGSDVVCLHVGSEEQGGEPERHLVAELGLEGRVLFLGPRSDVPVILAASDVFAMPSRYEGLGLAVVEAAASGLRLVLADSPGLRELALLLPEAELAPVSPEGLATRLGAALAAGPLSCDARADQARRMQSAFDVHRGVREYLALYRRTQPALASARGMGHVA